MPLNKKTKALLRVGVSAGLLALLVVIVDWSEALRELARIRPALLFLVLCILALQFVMNAWKWRAALLMNGVRVPFGELFRVYGTGAFFSTFLPSSVGGDVYRAVRTSRYCSLALATFSVVLERVLGLVALLLVMLLGILWLGFREGALSTPVFSALSLLLVGAYFVAPVLLLGSLARTRRWKERLPARLAPLAAAIDTMALNRQRLLELLAVCLAFQLIASVAVALLFVGVGVNWAVAEAAVANGAGSLAAILPISINGLGVTEASFAGVAAQLGIGLTEATIVSFLLRILVLPLVVAFGLLYMVEERGGAPVVPATGDNAPMA